MKRLLLVAALSTMSGCAKNYSVCVPMRDIAYCKAGYSHAEARREARTLDWFTSPEVVKTPDKKQLKAMQKPDPGPTPSPNGVIIQ